MDLADRCCLRWRVAGGRQLGGVFRCNGFAGFGIVEGLAFRSGPGRWRRVAMYVVGALPGAAFMAWLNTRWYGGVAASGYGTASELFSLARIPANIVRYGGWLIETSPLALLGVAALLVPVSPIWPRPSGLRAALLLAFAAAGACALYLVY